MALILAKSLESCLDKEKNGLTEAGIDITIDKLLNMYKLIEFD